jgi:uncharacterized membrane protein YhaH (DUF805 family)
MGALSVLPFGRVSLLGFWVGLVIVAVVVLAGVAIDLHVLRPDQMPAWWPPNTGNENTAALLAALPGPASAIAGLIAAWLLVMGMIRRLHDRGFGGMLLVWKIAIMAGLGWTAWNIERFVPGTPGAAISAVTGIVFALLFVRVLIICLFLRGQIGANRFGPDPVNAE